MPRPPRGCGVLYLLTLLGEFEERRVHYWVASGILTFAQVELQRLAGVGVVRGALPVELVVAATQVLQSGRTRRILLDQVYRRRERAIEASSRHRHAREVRNGVAASVSEPPLQRDCLTRLRGVQDTV